MKVAQILHDLGYSFQSNRKTEEGADHPDRDGQFRHINLTVKQCLTQGIPVISVDTKKKELVGNYENGGQQWRPAKQPSRVQGHDFPSPEVPRAYPYGIYDIGRNAGFVNVGTNPNGCFPVASIEAGAYSGQTHLSGCENDPDHGRRGRKNGWRLRLWKLELQKFADQTGVHLGVSFSSRHQQMEQNRAPAVFLHLVKLARAAIAGLRNGRRSDRRTTTAKGLKVTCRLDRGKYPTGREVSDDEMQRVNLKPNKFHGEWNYLIKPNVKTS